MRSGLLVPGPFVFASPLHDLRPAASAVSTSLTSVSKVTQGPHQDSEGLRPSRAQGSGDGTVLVQSEGSLSSGAGVGCLPSFRGHPLPNTYPYFLLNLDFL